MEFSSVKRVSIALVVLISGALAAGAEPIGAGGTAPSAVPAMRPWDPGLDQPAHTRVWSIRYRAHTGRVRFASVLLPRWYGPATHPRIPLVISPHGRGTDGSANLRLWGDLPGLGGFAVVNPDGEGNHLGAYSWGAPGQIQDLARMPTIVRGALPWLRIDRSRVYAVGGSMGGQETLLLLAKHPRLLAGAAAFDSLVDFAHQYNQFPRLPCNSRCRNALGESLGSRLQGLARIEVGGSPNQARSAFAARSPITYARAIASACVPLQLWWSRRDRIVVDPQKQSGRLLHEIMRVNPSASVEGIEGTWAHSAEMRASTRLPFALARFGLLPKTFDGRWGYAGARVTPSSDAGCESA